MTITRPFMKFYPGDWRQDPALRMCDLATRGLWIEMLCIMHEAEPYGHLNVKGVPLTDKDLARMVGADLKQVRKSLQVLLQVGVSSTTCEGVTYSRRMVHDFAKALKDKQNGGLGGNPRVKGGVNPRVKAHARDVRDHIESPKAPTDRKAEPAAPGGVKDSGSNTADIRDPVAKMVEALFRDFPDLARQAGNAGFLDTSPLVRLVAGENCDLGLDVETTIRGILSRKGRPPNSWGYFAPAIRRARDERVAALPVGAPAIPVQVDGALTPDADGVVRFAYDDHGTQRRLPADDPRMIRKWVSELGRWNRDKRWARLYFGPTPAEAGCLCPPQAYAVFEADELPYQASRATPSEDRTRH
jgi:hypothetical protein